MDGTTHPTREGAKLIEIVHLALLQVLPSHMPVGDYVVKGGANLRLFYDSRRRSQDIDLDYIGSRPERIEDQVDGAVASAAVGKGGPAFTWRSWESSMPGQRSQKRRKSVQECSSRSRIQCTNSRGSEIGASATAQR